MSYSQFNDFHIAMLIIDLVSHLIRVNFLLVRDKKKDNHHIYLVFLCPGLHVYIVSRNVQQLNVVDGFSSESFVHFWPFSS